MNQIKRAAEIVGGLTKLAEALGVTPQAVAFWRDGKRRMPAEVCPAIERATSGAVTRRDLRPGDWMDVWPELVRAAVPAPQEPWDGITERRKLDAQGEASRPACEMAAAVPVGMVLISDRRSPDAPADRRVSTESVAQAAFKLGQQGTQQEGV